MIGSVSSQRFNRLGQCDSRPVDITYCLDNLYSPKHGSKNTKNNKYDIYVANELN